MEFRRAVPQDFPAILRLQAANYIGNLSIDDREEGFLSAEFTPEQIGEMAAAVGIVVASERDSILGYLCGFRRDFDHHSRVIDKMLEQFQRIEYGGNPLDSYKTFIYGPACVDRAHRGRGLLRGLYEALKKEVAGQFEVGVAFVARDNPHSLRAHVEGLGMAEAGEFEVNGKLYVILAFRVAL